MTTKVSIGDQYGQWVVSSLPWTEQYPTFSKRKVAAQCLGCLDSHDVLLSNLVSGKSTGKKAANLTTHGMSGTPLHGRWKAMKNRCSCDPDYQHVSVDPVWETFEGFLENPPGGEFDPDKCLARYGDTGNYNPENCRWLTNSDNARERNGKPLLDNPELEASHDR